ncbi:hypothetical protein POMI540_4278 [Schizosaccharomyces pombe]|uniref:Meiotically up-regulated gene 154 protein n=1 Tax=Schizosaccharomyces pombe (strain 972 / ATCC 24843) TaxID=284812 RepID=MU154_SCHPO|nr:protein mug154 [Schizosaccharomyces pombe]P87236.1 RecName: Full=Meiotically up-regulated gene 154 protein [Schizosaccharomyces pombe 972h-]CAB09766.1 conserved fungal protein [Schizosaccharomyces pombe]|eukprot:NP_587827.1 protein mug154 [Schizosaccharomyces pombe]
MGKLIRRTSLTSKIINLPIDYFIYVCEQFDSVEWDKVSDRYSIPFSLAVNFIFLLMRIYIKSTHVPVQRNQLFVDKQSINTSRSWFRAFLSFLSICFLFISFLNFIFSTRFQNKLYRTLPQDKRTTTSTPNVKPVFQHSNNDDGDEQVFELKVWSPNQFLLNFACLFSPAHALILWFYSTSLRVTLLTFLLSFTTLHFVNKFSLLLKDQQYLHRQVFFEYDKKFVEPRLSVVKRDVAINTTRGPTTASIEYFTPRKPIDTFLEHRSSSHDHLTSTPRTPIALQRRSVHHLHDSGISRDSSSPFKRFPHLSDGSSRF